MKVTPKNIAIKQLVQNYKDAGGSSVTGFDGLLDIRPPYQREEAKDR